MKLLQINVSANWGSHGKIAEAIGKLAMKDGWESMIAYGRYANPSESRLIRIGSEKDIRIHGATTRLFDRHGLESAKATRDFIKIAEDYDPDIIHLHNIHGYYLNYPLLFDWLKDIKKPVVWTLHDCWPWTGHCAYYTYSHCEKWKTECTLCPGLTSYPQSFIDGSKRNFNLKKESFRGVENLTLVPVSNWLANDIKQSFLREYPVEVIHNGIDVDIFKPSDSRTFLQSHHLGDRKIILGVASVWEKRKGLEEFIRLRQLLDSSYHFILVGLTEKQIKTLPTGITGLTRTNNVSELVELYSSADVFVNPTLEDNFPTTNLEALACGTPVITYDTGGSPEAINENTGIVVPYNDIDRLKEAIIHTCEVKQFSSDACREWAEVNFNQNEAFAKYITIYGDIIIKKFQHQ